MDGCWADASRRGPFMSDAQEEDVALVEALEACNQMKCQKCEAKLHKPLDQAKRSSGGGKKRVQNTKYFLQSSDD